MRELIELAGLSLVHTFVAALCVEALLLLWRVGDPSERLRYRLLVLAVPLVLTPALALLPFRRTDAFRDGVALFSGAEWNQLHVLGLPAGVLLGALYAASGLALLLPDLARAGRRPHPRVTPAGPEILSVAASLGAGQVPILAVDAASGEDAGSRGIPYLAVRGILRPAVTVGPRIPSLLEPAQLRAALAHEVAHVSRRDPLLSWLLLAVRGLLFFNPVAQLVARAAAQELERRADDDAARASSPRAVASALLRLQNGSRGVHAVEDRARRLLRPGGQPGPGYPAARLALTGAGLLSLLLFVV